MDGILMQNVILCVAISTLVSVIVELTADYVRRRRMPVERRNVSIYTSLPTDGSNLPMPRNQSVEVSISQPPALPVSVNSSMRASQNRTTRAHIRTQPRELPQRIPIGRGNPSYFPRCPIHRCSNRPHEPQVIFWDDGRKMWRCHRGHYFHS